MTTDRNGRAHQPKGTPQGGQYAPRNTGGDDDLDVKPDLDRYAYVDDLSRVASHPAKDGESDDRELMLAWEYYDPWYEGSSSYMDRVISRRRASMTTPLHLDDPDGTYRRLLALRIHHHALQPDREIHRLGLEKYDDIPADGADDPYRSEDSQTHWWNQ